MNFTVVIPAYNCEAFLGACLNSLLAQTVASWNCIVVNDGSKDHTRDLAEGYATNDARILVINQENRGAAEARNLGIQLAKTPWIALLDGDDLFFEDTLERYEQALAAFGTRAGIIAGYYCQEPSQRRRSGHMTLVDGFPSVFGLRFGPTVSCSSAALSKRCFDEAGSFLNVACEDRDFWHRALAVAQVCQLDQTVALYRRDQPGTRNDSLRASGQIALAHRQILERNLAHPAVVSARSRFPGGEAEFRRQYAVGWNLLQAAYLLPNGQHSAAGECFALSWRQAEASEHAHLIQYLLDLLPYPQHQPLEAERRYAQLVTTLAGALPKTAAEARRRLKTSATEAFFRVAQELHLRGNWKAALAIAWEGLRTQPSFRTLKSFIRIYLNAR